MTSRRALLICGSLNQTTMMHAVGRELDGWECRYTPYYADGLLRLLSENGLLDFTIMGRGSRFRKMTDAYLADHGLPLDERGASGGYDLVLTCSDLIVPRNVRATPLVLVQEGMTDPDTTMTHVVSRLGLPLWLASTSTTGLSLAYRKFCVASEGYRDFFAARGVPADRIEVTGIPNYDDVARFLKNDQPLRGYVLAATSDGRETWKRDDRRAFVRRALEIAAGRPLVFKLHPNERWERAIEELGQWAPDARVFTQGKTEELIANCDVLITEWSTVVYIGLALGKECHSYFPIEQLRRLVPIQNGGASARRIAEVCRRLVEGEARVTEERRIA